MKILLTINWVERAQAPAPVCAITNVGGRTGDMEWKHSEDQAIAYIEDGLFEYFIKEKKQNLKIDVSSTPEGHKYLKVENGRATPLAQMSLPSRR